MTNHDHNCRCDDCLIDGNQNSTAHGILPKATPLDTSTLGPIKITQARLARASVSRRLASVAEGRTINGTYRLQPGEALVAFRADLAYAVAILNKERPL